MKDTITVIIVGLLFAIMSYLVGYNEGSKRPTEKLVLNEISKEIKNLQKDVVRWQNTAMILLIRMTVMEEWRGSIIYRPPELSLDDKKFIMEKYKKEKAELARRNAASK